MSQKQTRMTPYRLLLAIPLLLLFSFSGQAQFQVNNDAVNLGGGTYTLTPAANNMAGSIWYKLQHDLSTPLNIQGQFFFGDNANQGDPGADGIAFVLQNNCLSAGSAGGGIGYAGIPGQSIIVEFDTYENTAATGAFENHDPSYDHVAIMRDGIVDHATASNLFGPVAAAPANSNIEDNNWHTFQIQYNPTTTVLQVTLDGNLLVNYTYDIVANIFGGNPYVYWGFTSSTGGFYNLQQVYIDANLSTFVLDDQTTCSAPVTVSLPPLTRYYHLNQSLHRNAVISSAEGGNPLNALEAIDGNMGTRWSSQFSDPQWIYVDLGSSFDLDSAYLYWEAARAATYEIQVSNDALSWTTIYSHTGGGGALDKLMLTGAGRYVRMYGTTRTTGYGYSLWEFQIYGKPRYVWSPNDGSIDDIYSENPTFTPAVTTTYTVTIPDQCSGSVPYNMTVTVDCASLPVTLLSFTGHYLGGVAKLNWITTLEENTSYFTVMHSTDGVHFSPVQKVAAAGHSQTTLQYGIEDTHVEAGLNYYQLITTDLDGQTSRSNVVMLTKEETQVYLTDPVFNTSTTLVLPAYTEAVGITVVDVQGRIISEEQFDSTEGSITIGQSLAKGFYLVIVQTASERQVLKLVKE